MLLNSNKLRRDLIYFYLCIFYFQDFRRDANFHSRNVVLSLIIFFFNFCFTRSIKEYIFEFNDEKTTYLYSRATEVLRKILQKNVLLGLLMAS